MINSALAIAIAIPLFAMLAVDRPAPAAAAFGVYVWYVLWGSRLGGAEP